MRGTRTRWALVTLLAALGCGAHTKATVVAAPAMPAAAPALTTTPPVAESAPPNPQLKPPAVQEAPPPEETAADTRGWLGVELEAALPEEAGVRIGRVVPKSPAERAGLLAGDLVTRLDDVPVRSPSEVVGVVSHKQAGTRLGVAFLRQKAERLTAVTLGALPERDEIYRMTFIDQPAPAFQELTPVAGSLEPTLAAERGHVVVVEFWAPWCVACRALIPHMNDLQAKFGARGARIIGITADPVASTATAATELGMKYAVFSDESGKTLTAYQAMAIPAVFVIDRKGVVRDVMLGYDTVHLPKLDALVEHLVETP